MTDTHTGEHATGPWLFIGAGNMGSAIASGGVASGVMAASNVAAFDPHAEPSGAISSVFRKVDDAVSWLKQHPGSGIILATKPQMFPEVASIWQPHLLELEPRLLVSILAGTRCKTIAAGLGSNMRVVRVMPNTPIRLGLGMSAVAAGPGALESDIDRVERLFGSIGKTIRIDETQMDAFTGVAGSGPAYVFYLAEAMVDAATRLGFDREQALQMVRQTISGAGSLLGQSDMPPEELRAAVTSKGGTTAAATNALDDAGVKRAVVDAISAAEFRGRELSVDHE